MQTKLFVRNLSYSTQESDLSSLFSQYGDVVSAQIAMDRQTNRPRGFAFIEMGTQQSAEQAISALDNSEFGGRTIHVSVSEPRRGG